MVYAIREQIANDSNKMLPLPIGHICINWRRGESCIISFSTREMACSIVEHRCTDARSRNSDAWDSRGLRVGQDQASQPRQRKAHLLPVRHRLVISQSAQAEGDANDGPGVFSNSRSTLVDLGRGKNAQESNQKHCGCAWLRHMLAPVLPVAIGLYRNTSPASWGQ